jgi:RHH-type rel operon transcriptional repressor/antitoxin RelB
MQYSDWSEMSTAISVRLPDEIAIELDEIARETDRSKSYLIQKAIEAYLEDMADLQVSLDRLHDTNDEVISLDDMKKNLGL